MNLICLTFGHHYVQVEDKYVYQGRALTPRIYFICKRCGERIDVEKPDPGKISYMAPSSAHPENKNAH